MGHPYQGQSSDAQVPGIRGENTAAYSSTGHSIGVYGLSSDGNGVVGESHSSQHAAVAAINVSGGMGVYVESKGDDGVRAYSHSSQHAAISATNDGGGVGLWIASTGHDGVQAHSHSSQHAAVSATNDGGGYAGYFQGNVTVTGDVILSGADCAEEFDAAQAVEIEPGTVMVLDRAGALQPSQQAYDKRVAGVISGAGDYKPGIVLDKQQSLENRVPVALVGKVYCKVDAQYAPIEVGDLLTTSPTPGHAMKANDPLKAFGAVIGKALRPLEAGQELLPILIALQ